MEREIKISEEVMRLISGRTYNEGKIRARFVFNSLKNKVEDLMKTDVKERNWQILTEKEFEIHHQENIAEDRCSIVVANRTSYWKTTYLFAEGTELKRKFCVRMRKDKMKERNIFDGFDKFKLESKNVILPIGEMGRKVGRVFMEMLYFPIKIVENLKPRLRNRD